MTQSNSWPIQPLHCHGLVVVFFFALEDNPKAAVFLFTFEDDSVFVFPFALEIGYETPRSVKSP
jgi:hypothetical protein